ncbi:MAG: hypothetical protein JWN40_388 [Phycisphaerales bacterium]|nr:hypothetical protein [Phycisphaerales bacterium]
MRRFTAILLLIGFVALGTGLLESLHLRTHLLEHAQAKAARTDQQQQPIPSDDDCELCAQLHLPKLDAGWVPLLVCLGLFVAFLTLLTPPLARQRVLVRIGCRGPPVL